MAVGGRELAAAGVAIMLLAACVPAGATLSSLQQGSGAHGRTLRGKAAADTWRERAGSAFTQLASMYNWETGLFNGGTFWTTANGLEAMIDYCRLVGQPDKCAPYLKNSHAKASKNGFMSKYYDDAGWWGITFVKAAQLMGEKLYMDTARRIHGHMQRAWTPDCGGGLLWAQPGAGRPASIANNYKAAVANQLFMALSVMLSEQSGSNERSAYTQEFERTWGWLQGRGVVRPDGSVYDGINPDCKLHPGWPLWSYNQIGGAVGALLRLHKNTGQRSYLDSAHKLARAGIETMSDDDGIVTEQIDACNQDSAQFKGVYARYLGQLADATDDATYRDHLLKNAETAWSKGRANANSTQVGCRWQGPFANVPGGNSAAQGAALDLFNAAARVA